MCEQKNFVYHTQKRMSTINQRPTEMATLHFNVPKQEISTKTKLKKYVSKKIEKTKLE